MHPTIFFISDKTGELITGIWVFSHRTNGGLCIPWVTICILIQSWYVYSTLGVAYPHITGALIPWIHQFYFHSYRLRLLRLEWYHHHNHISRSLSLSIYLSIYLFLLLFSRMQKLVPWSQHWIFCRLKTRILCRNMGQFSTFMVYLSCFSLDS